MYGIQMRDIGTIFGDFLAMTVDQELVATLIDPFTGGNFIHNWHFPWLLVVCVIPHEDAIIHLAHRPLFQRRGLWNGSVFAVRYMHALTVTRSKLPVMKMAFDAIALNSTADS